MIRILTALGLALLVGLALPPVLPAEAQEAAAEAEAEGPALPPEILDPATETEELTLRLIPLTKDELAAAAAEWLAIVKAKTEEVAEAQVSVLRTEGEAADAARTRVTDLTTERKALFDKYSTIVDSWEKKGGDEAAIAEYRAYRNSIIVEETRTADAETLLQQAWAWTSSWDGGVGLLIDATIVILAFAALWFAARFVKRFAGKALARIPNLSKLLQAFLAVAIYWITIALGLMIVLSALGVDISPLFALIGGAAFILAFALQDTLGNLASGLMIMINRPFDEGDYVDVGGTAGTVRSVSIVATTVTTPDNQVIVIPNKNVWGNVITNVTASPTRRVDFTFGIGYGDDIGKAIAILKEVVEEHPLTLDTPEPTIVVGALGASSVDLLCRPWSKTSDYWTVYWDITRTVKERFDAAGITIPYPQQDVHMHTVEATPPPQPRTMLASAEPEGESQHARTRKGDDAAAVAAGEEGHEASERAD